MFSAKQKPLQQMAMIGLTYSELRMLQAVLMAYRENARLDVLASLSGLPEPLVEETVSDISHAVDASVHAIESHAEGK